MMAIMAKMAMTAIMAKMAMMAKMASVIEWFTYFCSSYCSQVGEKTFLNVISTKIRLFQQCAF